ncbi:hypothetical protein AK830_g3337 [Neonectria ditissima]|uniref:Apple domain-containing protein n=1 Tax=Neonectria ditissima TaxID=78410 RepID=A0A0P7BPB3_9HYPO|nr:hypothetical protein AK830_g3337 [Neonectria ditissima]
MNWFSMRILYTALLANTVPTLAHCIDPLVTSARVEARQALATPTVTRTPPDPRQYPRQEDDSVPIYTVTFAPNSTCGYLSGSVQIPITCENSGRCLWELEYFRYIACEIDGKGHAHTKCLQRDEALDSDLCDDVCESNTYNLFCTNEDEPYCRTYAFPKGARDYRCASTPATRVSSVDFTYDGETTSDTTISTIRDGPPISYSTTASTTASEETSVSSVESSSTAEPEGDSDRSSVNVAAIAGGCGSVGGFLLGILVTALYYRLRHSKPNNSGPPAPAVQDTDRDVSSRDQAPPVVLENSSTPPDRSSTPSHPYYNFRATTIPLLPSLSDHPGADFEFGNVDIQRLSPTRE